MTYPRVLSEDLTMAAALSGLSLARYGDGELNIAAGSKSISQRADKHLQAELLAILAGEYGPNVLPCIPNLDEPRMSRAAYFARFRERRYTDMYKRSGPYGSVFVSRPECAPWIDRPDYWDSVRSLWRGQSVVYVSGDDRLLDVMLDDYCGVNVIHAPRRDAYSIIDELTRECLSHRDKRVIIALGAAGTVLAARLGKHGQHALDLGHMGMFMQNEGAYAIPEDDLTSPEYRAEIRELHTTKNWGAGGYSWTDKVLAFAAEIGATDAILDYGCGQGSLAKAINERGGIKCNNYDPGRPEFAMPPKLADLVVSTDVFEHIETDKVDSVLKHCFLLARKGGFFAIAKQPAKAILPRTGRNAHLTCQPTEWWVKRLKAAGWSDVRVVEDQWKKCLVLCRK